MRRLAKATRNDVYGSRRDYQDLIEKEAPCFSPTNPTASNLAFYITGLKAGNTDLCGFGAYVHVESANTCRIRVRAGEDVIVTRDFELGKGWNRIGMAAPSPGADELAIDLSFLQPCKSFALWGVNCSNMVGLSLPSGEPKLDSYGANFNGLSAKSRRGPALTASAGASCI